MKLVIVGGGRLTYFLGRTLIAKGHEVTVVTNDLDECAWLARGLPVLAIHGDGSDPFVLEEAGAGSADQLLAVTPLDHVNLVVCQLARLRFLVPRVLALVNDPDNERAFVALGVTARFSTIPVLASLIEQRSAFDDVVNLLPLADGRVTVTEVLLASTSPAAGRAIADLGLPRGALIGAIVRGDTTSVPHGATQLRAGDRLVVIAQPDNHAPVLRALTGER